MSQSEPAFPVKMSLGNLKTGQFWERGGWRDVWVNYLWFLSSNFIIIFMAHSTNYLTKQGPFPSHPSCRSLWREGAAVVHGLPQEGLSGIATCHFFSALAPAEMNVSLKIVSVAGHWGIRHSFPSHPLFFISCSTPGTPDGIRGGLKGWGTLWLSIFVHHSWCISWCPVWE